jgi:hypothetical protein
VTPTEIGQLLAYAAAFDKRTVGEADVIAWHDVLSDLHYDRAKDAIRAWYADHDTMIMPANVRRAVKAATPPWARPASEVLDEIERNVEIERRQFRLDGYQVGRDMP